MNNIIVLKFGGSSISDNKKLELVARRITKIYDSGKKVVVVLSAQGKTTDKLIREAKELSNNIPNRELDALLSCGEQMSTAKLSILLNFYGYPAISLTGWQAGILTDKNSQNANILKINTSRILKELNNEKIVVVTGFQGINENLDITTLGRGGSDTTAVAIASALNCDNCYIFSDVDGVYTADPNKITNTKKLENISYKEMQELSNEGAKVLHNRCVQIGEKFDIPIITKSTFNEEKGTVISNIIEDNSVKSIIKKDVSKVSIIGNGIIRNYSLIGKIIEYLKDKNFDILKLEITEMKISIIFKNIIKDESLQEIHKLIF